MIRTPAFVLAAALQAASHAAAAHASAPDENHLFQLTKMNRGQPWLRVTTNSSRYKLKVDRFDVVGLHGFEAEDEAPAPRGPLAWDEIKRVDEIVTRGRSYGTKAAVVLGLVGAGIGNALGAPDAKGGSYAFVGLLTGGLAGAWLGSSFGNRYEKEVNWYTAPPPATPGAPPTGAVALVAADSSHEPPTPAKALKFAASLGPDEHVRVSGSFGKFQGYVGVAGPYGLEHLVVKSNAPEAWRPQQLPDHIPWSAVDEVQTRGGHVVEGALGTGLAFAGLGALLGAAAVAVSDSDNVGVGPGAAYGAAVLGGTGAVIGAGLGAISRGWKTVYRRH